VKVCPLHGIELKPGGLERSSACIGCFACCEECPAGAHEGKGHETEVKALARQLVKDRAYWGKDGGVTLSGGEALMQEGMVDLLCILKFAGVHTALDTCGFVPAARLERALAYTDLVLYDLKLADPVEHKELTGVSNAVILDNLKTVAAWAVKGGRLWIRTPIIPGATDSAANISGIAAILNALPEGAVERWELCAFNNLCGAKYKSLGLSWAYEGIPLMEKAMLEALVALAEQTDCCPNIRWTGAAQRTADSTS
jgi:pyruvate formate lyase activating enzyme